MKAVSRSIVISVVIAFLSLAAQAADTYPASGRINRVEIARGEVNITHGPITGPGWPGMTMTFPVADKAVTKSLKAGEKVRFWLEKRDDHYVVTRIEPVKTAK